MNIITELVINPKFISVDEYYIISNDKDSIITPDGRIKYSTAAFLELKDAIKKCPSGYSVFDKYGNEVYHKLGSDSESCMYDELRDYFRNEIKILSESEIDDPYKDIKISIYYKNILKLDELKDKFKMKECNHE